MKILTENLHIIKDKLFRKNKVYDRYLQEEKNLADLLVHTKKEIENIEGVFNNIVDEDIMESVIYRLKSLKSFENYIYKHRKEIYMEMAGMSLVETNMHAGFVEVST